MAVLAGRHQLGPDRGRIVLRTFRDGLAAQAGHDLTIEATRWSGVLAVNEDLSPAGLEVRIDMGALVVRDGTGGVKPLTDRDRREIAVTVRKVLTSDRHPEAVFVAARFEPKAGEGGEISGTLTIRGQGRPLRLRVSQTGADRYHAEGSYSLSTGSSRTPRSSARCGSVTPSMSRSTLTCRRRPKTRGRAHDQRL